MTFIRALWLAVLQVEPPHVRPPGKGEVRLTRPAPPQPQLLGNTGLTGQPLHLDQHQRAVQDRPIPSAVTWSGAMLDLGMDPGPGADAHLAVLVMQLGVLGAGWPPTARSLAGELR